MFLVKHLAHPFPNFLGGGAKSATFGSFLTPLDFEPPAFENEARYEVLNKFGERR